MEIIIFYRWKDGYGNVDATIDRPLESIDEIRELESQIRNRHNHEFVCIIGWQEFAPPKSEAKEATKSTATNNERDEIFECLDRLEYCSPKSEPWIKANAKSIRKFIQKLSPIS